MVEIGDRIKDLREQRGVTQETLAKKLDISQAYLSQLESGQRNLDAILLVKIAEVLDYDIHEFLPSSKKIKGKAEMKEIGRHDIGTKRIIIYLCDI